MKDKGNFKKMNISFRRDDTIPSFGAFLANNDTDEERVVLINCEINFNDSLLEYEDGESVSLTSNEIKRAFIETMMHEFGHALEEYFKLNFDEDWIEQVCESYKTS